ncbi:MAG: twin-arginine translocase TatA/TatE family subunit [Chloroflexi bacterium]|nr:twin-arginine translocase TatA/TatE family subunit [Chloroflexota bacterium]
MFDIGVPELLIILVIVILLFGVGRIGKIAGEMGKGIREFRDGLNGVGEETKTSNDKQESQKEA